MSLMIGTVLRERYEIQSLLGQGGFGAVYKALDRRLQIEVAVKENLQTSPQSQRQFEKEAMLLARLRHPNLTKVTDHFSLPHQGQYLVMEYIDGLPLSKMKLPLTEAQALNWLTQIADALSYLHEQKIIHRDIKPPNILVTREGQAVLVDFGISKSMEGDASTSTGARGLTPGFAPIEQYKGRTDERTDVYALAATMYYLLTNERPPDAIDRIAESIALRPPRQLRPEISPQVEAAIMKGLETTASNRHQGMADFRTALSSRPVVASFDERETVVAGSSAFVPASQGVPATTKPVKGIALGVGVGGLILVVLFGALGALLWTTTGGNNGVVTATSAFVTEVAASPDSPTDTPPDPLTDTPIPPTNTPESPTNTPAPIENPQSAIGNPDMVLIPAGEFTMGSEVYDDEKPVHTVYVEAFYMDQFEVTNAQYAEFLNARGNQTEGEVTWLDIDDGDVLIAESGGQFQAKSGYGNHPVIEVSWYGAKAYCEWADKRLPTEAEWEKAARGTDGRVYPWGDESPNDTLANYNGNVGGTAPVGSYELGKSPYGVYDLAGNVWEWTLSAYEDYPYDDDGRNDTNKNVSRVIRGGSWYDDADYVRASDRFGSTPGKRDYDVGFRCMQ